MFGHKKSLKSGGTDKGADETLLSPEIITNPSQNLQMLVICRADGLQVKEALHTPPQFAA
ncbi:hypothetical protein [Methylovulum miyakonense]|uniref:hypothetical protein n=1 Tax=Methylovulum miyakonense TaxID=645578 RepID=UPI000377BBF1|nr:hypothetical protein [Methylovulum miyakonense]